MCGRNYFATVIATGCKFLSHTDNSTVCQFFVYGDILMKNTKCGSYTFDSLSLTQLLQYGNPSTTHACMDNIGIISREGHHNCYGWKADSQCRIKLKYDGVSIKRKTTLSEETY